MPIWLVTLIPTIGKFLAHNFARLAGILVILSLLAMPFLWWRHHETAWQNKVNSMHVQGINEGYKDGYAQATKDRPTYGSVGTVVNNPDYRWVGFKITIWKIKFGVGA
jgi:hypothetical protein